MVKTLQVPGTDIVLKEFDYKVIGENGGGGIDIIGASGGGKSVIANHIAFMKRNLVARGLAIFKNEDYTRGITKYGDFLARAYIRDDVYTNFTGELIFDSLLENQKEFKLSQKIAFDFDTLKSIIDKNKELFKKTLKSYASLHKKYKNTLKKLDTTNETKLLEVNHQLKCVTAFRKAIRKKKDKVDKTDLNEQENACMDIIRLNTHMIFIMDDCVKELDGKDEKKCLEVFFKEGRHADLITIVLAHTYTDIPKKIRRNAQFTFFAKSAPLLEYIKANSIPAKYRKLADFIYKGENAEKHLKIVYSLEDNEFLYTHAELHGNFELGTHVFRDYGEQLKKTEGSKLDGYHNMRDKMFKV